MDVLRVCSGGLEALAAQCLTQAVAVQGGALTPATGPPSQATSAAVASGYAAIGTTAGVLAARIQATGTKLGESAREFAAQEASSTHQIAAVSQPVEL
jgi:hypothetical protein